MAKGIAVFWEKPLAAELTEACAIAETARRTGARVQAGFHRRFDPDYRVLHETVVSGAAGRVLTPDSLPWVALCLLGAVPRAQCVWNRRSSGVAPGAGHLDS